MAGDDRIKVVTYTSLDNYSVYEIKIDGKPWFTSIDPEDTRLALQRAKANLGNLNAKFLPGAKGMIAWMDELYGPIEALKMIPESYGDW